MKYILLATALIIPLFLNAQSGTSTSGGDARGDNGSVSFTIGQVVYSANSGSGGLVSQGVQQALEVQVLSGLAADSALKLDCFIFPNPANDYVILNTANCKLENPVFFIYNEGGKLLLSNKVKDYETKIQMQQFNAGIYLLKVVDNSKELKIFKIIKT